MKGLFAALWAEGVKVRKTKIFWTSLLLFFFIAIMMGLFMFVSKNPDIAEEFGFLGTKASILNIEANWSNYLLFLNMVASIFGLLVFGFITAWIFGREYTDRTIKDLIALPISRQTIVSAKFIILVVWCMLLSAILIFTGIVMGILIELPGGTNEYIWEAIRILSMVSLLTITLCSPIAFIASYSKGYLGPLAFLLLTLIIPQLLVVLGWTPYIPWSIPSLYAGIGAGGEVLAEIELISYIILFSTSIIGLICTYASWRFKDQT